MGVIANFFNRLKPETVKSVRMNFSYSGGTVVNEQSSMEVAAYYRGVIYLSTQIAKLPWDVKGENNEVIENDVSFMLNVAPNPETTSYHLKLYLIQCAINNGNGYAEIERYPDGRPRYLWPLNPKKVEPFRDTQGNLWYRVKEGAENLSDVVLRPRDIFIVRNLHTLDSFQGQGLVAWAANTLGISLGADKFANALYTNGGLPSGVLTAPGSLSPEARQRLADSWKAGFGGRKTGSTAVLENGVTYNPVSHSPDVLQFLESRKFGVLEIARFLGLPPTKLFDTDSAKFSNLENANLEVATDTLDAWARNLESEADVKLLANRFGGRRTEFDLYAVFRGDMATRSTYFKNMLSIGAMNPNEIRKKEGLSRVDGMDRYFIATNNFTSHDKMDELADAQIDKLKSEAERNRASSQPADPATQQVDNAINNVVANILKQAN